MKAISKSVTITYELSRSCNLRCRFCYNTWKSSAGGARGQLTPKQSLDLINKVIDETGCVEISLSGGEPLLREDVFDLIALIKKRGVKACLVTNGTRLTPEAIDECISSGVDAFQITLLSDRRELHNRLAGSESFDKVIEAILNIRKKRGTVYTFFVGLKQNITTFKGTLELNVLLDVRNMAVGRFTPGGAGLRGWEEMMPSPDQIQKALESASQMSRRFPISVSISTPVLPCLSDPSKYDNVSLGFCAVGNPEHALFAIDPMGNLKVCSHSSYIFGSLLEKPFADLLKDRFLADFVETLPQYCRDCAAAAVCRGGCRSSAHLCYGSLEDEDPYLHRWKAQADKSKAEHLMLKRLRAQSCEVPERAHARPGRKSD